MNDPIGKAIQQYVAKPSKKWSIIVHSKICEDDDIPVHYLFRKYVDFPKLEKLAMQHCRGKILDVGAGAGPHAKYLQEKGFSVEAIDVSPIAVDYLRSIGISARAIDFLQLNGETYDTLLLLMNGIGIAGTLKNLEQTLLKAYHLLNENGIVLLETTDIIYLFEEEDGSRWLDLTAEYYGNFEYQMEFEGEIGEWFDWLFVDFEKLSEIAQKIGFKVELLYNESYQYLVKLQK